MAERRGEEETKRKRSVERRAEQEVFRASKRTVRSPRMGRRLTGGERGAGQSEMQEGEEETRDLKEMMRAMMEELRLIREDGRQVKEGLEEVRKENERLRREMEGMRMAAQEREENWQRERKELMGRVKDLEDEEEKKDKRARKNNVIITGMDWREGKRSEDVETWLRRDLGVEAEVKEAYEVGGNKLVARIGSWEQKQRVMRSKSELKNGKNNKVFIDHDLTPKEREVQRVIRGVAKEERTRGRRVEVGYRRLKVDGRTKSWNDDLGRLMEKN